MVASPLKFFSRDNPAPGKRMQEKAAGKPVSYFKAPWSVSPGASVGSGLCRNTCCCGLVVLLYFLTQAVIYNWFILLMAENPPLPLPGGDYGAGVARNPPRGVTQKIPSREG